MRANFKFHPVGQGCFYTGVIPYDDDKEFVMVYDCGSVTSGTYLGDAIADFRKNHDYIDLLVVSHLDQDHFNGIQKLLFGTHVKRIVLPYLSLMERLVLLASTEGASTSFSSFLMNPVAFLRSQDFKRIDNISFIEAAANEDENKQDENRQDEIKAIQSDQIALFGDIEILRGFEEDEAFRSRVEEDELLEEPNVSFLPFNTSAILHDKKMDKDIWEFVFYHRKLASSVSIASFQKAVKIYLHSHRIAKSYKMFDEKHVEVLKQFYEDHIAFSTKKFTTNSSSICLYHGAIEEAYTRGNINSTSMWIGRWWYPNRKKLYKSGTILTGDQELKTNRDFNAFCLYFKSKLNNVEVFQVPHHGGNPNWNRMPNILNIYDIGCYVINHGFVKNTHPHPEVLENLIKNTRRVIVLNNEFAHFDYIVHKL